MIKKKTKRILAILSIFLSILLVIFIINQSLQFARNLGAIHPLLADISIWVILVFLSACILISIYLFFKLPKRLSPPKNKGPEFDRYIKNVSKRLTKNKAISKSNIHTREEVESALIQLDEIATLKIKESGKQAFYSTAVSQNGSLDALAILGIQMKLIWKVAHLYLQRPSIRDMSYLYSNVFMTAFIASQIDEAEYLEAIEPILSTVFGSAITAVPGTSIFVNSIISGSSNAFLTLRVGIITQQYCNSLTKPEQTAVRKKATTEAGKMILAISKEGTVALSNKLKDSFGEKFTGVFKDLNEKIKEKTWFSSKEA